MKINITLEEIKKIKESGRFEEVVATLLRLYFLVEYPKKYSSDTLGILAEKSFIQIRALGEAQRSAMELIENFLNGLSIKMTKTNKNGPIVLFQVEITE